MLWAPDTEPHEGTAIPQRQGGAAPQEHAAAAAAEELGCAWEAEEISQMSGFLFEILCFLFCFESHVSFININSYKKVSATSLSDQPAK